MSDEKVLQKTKAMPLDVNPEVLIVKAIDKGLPVETMERLLAMRRELKAEWAREEYFKALANFQEACPEIKKTKPVYNKNSTTVRYHYAPLEDIVKQCKDLLKENGFSYIIKTEQTEKSVKTINEMHHIAGHTEESTLTIPIDSADYLHMNAAQQVASARTYGKRYTFCDGFGILTGDEDDDAQSAGKIQTETEEPTVEKKKNGFRTPKEWKEDVEAMALELGTEHFEASDLQKAHEQIKKAKSLQDVKAIRQTWHLEFEKRVAAYEKMMEGAGKVFEEGAEELKVGGEE